MKDTCENTNEYNHFFFNDTATTEIYTLSLHDALPILWSSSRACASCSSHDLLDISSRTSNYYQQACISETARSEEHTSELQSRQYLVCRLLLEKKKYNPPLLRFLSTSISIFYSPNSCS